MLAHRHSRRMRTHRDELGQVIERVCRNVLEFGRDRRTALGKLIKRGIVIVGDTKMALSQLGTR